MKDKIRLEVMKVFDQEADVDTVVDNILLLFGDINSNLNLPQSFIDKIDSWDDIESEYYKITGDINSHEIFTEWLKDNYKTPDKL